jgi:type II secretory pathway component PulF
VGEKFVHRGVTQENQLALPHLKAWFVAVVVLSGAWVLLLLLGLLLSWVRALLCVVPGLSTIVAQMGWKLSGLGDLLLGLLDKAEPLPLLFPF